VYVAVRGEGRSHEARAGLIGCRPARNVAVRAERLRREARAE